MKGNAKTLGEISKKYRDSKQILELAEKVTEAFRSTKEFPEIGYVNQYLMSAVTKSKMVGEYRG